MQLDGLNPRPRDFSKGELQPFDACRSGCRRSVFFVRGNMAGQEPDLIKTCCLPCEVCEMDVPLMDRIEGATEDTEFRHKRRLVRAPRYRHQKFRFPARD